MLLQDPHTTSAEIELNSVQTFFQPDAFAGDRSHRCPICLQGMPTCRRYPAYVCKDCAGQAVDSHGEPLVYEWARVTGGVAVRGRSETGRQSCFVRGVPCEVGEARFGGFVMEVVAPSTESIPDVRRLSVRQLLSTHSALLEELRYRNVVRTGNNPAGDYVEWLVASRLGLSLEQNSAIGFDATCPDGRRYQIKGRRLLTASGSPQLGVIRALEAGHFDFLIAVVMNADWSIRLAVKIPHAALGELARFRGHVNGHVLRMTPGVLQIEGVEDLSRMLGEPAE